MAETLQKMAAKAVLVDPTTNRALILRLNSQERQARGIDEWHLPGGAQDNPNEPLKRAAQREVWEETGIDVERTKVIGMVDEAEWDAFYEGVPAHFQAKIFELEVIGEVPELALSDEHDEAAWVRCSELDNYPALKPEARKSIGAVLLSGKGKQHE